MPGPILGGQRPSRPSCLRLLLHKTGTEHSTRAPLLLPPAPPALLQTVPRLCLTRCWPQAWSRACPPGLLCSMHTPTPSRWVLGCLPAEAWADNLGTTCLVGLVGNAWVSTGEHAAQHAGVSAAAPCKQPLRAVEALKLMRAQNLKPSVKVWGRYSAAAVGC